MTEKRRHGTTDSKEETRIATKERRTARGQTRAMGEDAESELRHKGKKKYLV